MSGHSKWASIRHKKAGVDAKRSNIFTKIANTLTVAARRGGGDPAFNPTLRTALDAARKVNMPKDKIERAVKRGTGELGGVAVEEVLYEGFGPGNVAMLIAGLTDNRNRTNADVRTVLMKNGGRFAEGGGVAYQFTQKGVIRLEFDEKKHAQLEEVIIESGADDYRMADGYAIMYTNLHDLHTIRDFVVAAGFEVEKAEIEYVPNTPIEVGDEDMEKVAHLIELLDDYDDVTNVYTNLIE